MAREEVLKNLLSKLKKSLTYSGKCNDYDNQGKLMSPVFTDASDMAYVVEDDEVIDLTYKEICEFLTDGEFVAAGDIYQINPRAGVAWIYNSEEDIHYFYSL
jgi:hypothetical protein